MPDLIIRMINPLMLVRVRFHRGLVKVFGGQRQDLLRQILAWINIPSGKSESLRTPNESFIGLLRAQAL